MHEQTERLLLAAAAGSRAPPRYVLSGVVTPRNSWLVLRQPMTG
jgi:hypothetical protein